MQELRKKISDVSVMVLGDVMLDQYWWGSVERISPEAPVPVVRLKETSITLGGAANVAANIAGLLAKPVLIGCVGRDDDGDRFLGKMRDASLVTDHVVHLDGQHTPVKTRVVAHNQHVVRVDREEIWRIDPSTEQTLQELASKALAGVDIVVISDYAKGTVTPGLLRYILEECRTVNKPVIVDPKGKDYSKYAGATLLTPNRREAAEACGIDDFSHDGVNLSGSRLLADLDLDALVITEGEDGVTVFEKGGSPLSMKAEAREIYDVTGAGDTVIATLAVALAAGLPLVDGVRLANLAASLVVEQVGTTSITFDALAEKAKDTSFAFSNATPSAAA